MADILPVTTRLRFVSAKDPGDIQSFLDSLGFRVRIYNLVFDGKKWFCWFNLPDDSRINLESIDL